LTYTAESWHTGHKGYGNVGGFAFDPRDPNQIFAGRSTDVLSRSINGFLIDLTTGGLRATYFADRSMRNASFQTAENPSDGLSFGKDTSVRWTGALDVPSTGKYAFTGPTDGKSSLHVLIDGAQLRASRSTGSYSAIVSLRAGRHTLTIEYVNGGDNGYEQVLWQPPGSATAVQIPISAYA
jgi:hypothetical protein